MYHSFRHLLTAAALISLAGFSACQKSDVSPTNDVRTQLVGRWELTQTSGGFGGGTFPANPNQRIELELDASGRAQVLLNGTPTTTATYTLRQRNSYLTQRTETFLELPAPPHGTSFIAELSATKLVLSQDANDGLSATYRREQPQAYGSH
jgi:hypothetical protein